MFGRKNGAMGIVGDAAETLSPYADQLAHDEKLRQRLAVLPRDVVDAADGWPAAERAVWSALVVVAEPV